MTSSLPSACPRGLPGKHTGEAAISFLQGLPSSGIEPVSPASPALQVEPSPLNYREAQIALFYSA